MHPRSPAQHYSLVIGVTLLLGGILGFVYEASFATDEVERDALLGLFDVNGWHNVVHIASGLTGLAVARSWDGARAYALGFGLVYLAIAIVGFGLGDGEVLFDLLPINTEDNVLHLVIGLAGLIAWQLSQREPAPSTV